MKKNSIYHQLIVQYIEDIGSMDRPPASGDLPELNDVEAEGSWAIEQILEKDGHWVVYLVMFTHQALRFRKRLLKIFPSRRMAEIFARYRVEAYNQSAGTARLKKECFGLCWN